MHNLILKFYFDSGSVPVIDYIVHFYEQFLMIMVVHWFVLSATRALGVHAWGTSQLVQPYEILQPFVRPFRGHGTLYWPALALSLAW